MSCRTEWWGDEAHSDYGSVSNSAVAQYTLSVDDGVGTLVGYAEQNNKSESWQGVWDGTKKKVSSSSGEGSASGYSKATVNVDISQGKYQITWAQSSPIVGKSHWVECGEHSCTHGDRDLGIDAGQCGFSGDLSDPNHVQGSYSDLKSNVGQTGKGKMLHTETWNLARQGATK